MHWGYPDWRHCLCPSYCASHESWHSNPPSLPIIKREKWTGQGCSVKCKKHAPAWLHWTPLSSPFFLLNQGEARRIRVSTLVGSTVVWSCTWHVSTFLVIYLLFLLLHLFSYVFIYSFVCLFGIYVLIYWKSGRCWQRSAANGKLTTPHAAQIPPPKSVPRQDSLLLGLTKIECTCACLCITRQQRQEPLVLPPSNPTASNLLEHNGLLRCCASDIRCPRISWSLGEASLQGALVGLTLEAGSERVWAGPPCHCRAANEL